MNTSRKPTPERVARLEKQRIVDTLLKKADEAHTRHAYGQEQRLRDAASLVHGI